MNDAFKMPPKPLRTGVNGTQVKAKGEKEDTVN